jgi:hypothetical protein
MEAMKYYKPKFPNTKIESRENNFLKSLQQIFVYYDVNM